jgi:hypothetical protein
VRYYRAEQKSFAGDLVQELGKTLGLPAGPENAILVKRSRELPGGILEVWLPRLVKGAFSARISRRRAKSSPRQIGLFIFPYFSCSPGISHVASTWTKHLQRAV